MRIGWSIFVAMNPNPHDLHITIGVNHDGFIVFSNGSGLVPVFDGMVNRVGIVFPLQLMSLLHIGEDPLLLCSDFVSCGTHHQETVANQNHFLGSPRCPQRVVTIGDCWGIVTCIATCH